MKYLSYISCLLLLLLSGACSDDLLPEYSSADIVDGKPIDLLVGADFPELNLGASTRAMGEQPTVDDLRNNLKINLFVFDSSGVMLQFIEPKDITIESVDETTNHVLFRVHNIYSSTLPRRLHFVVTSAPDLRAVDGGEYITAMASETTVMPALVTSGVTDAYWGLSLEESIDENMTLKIKLIRNFVKLSVVTAPETKENFKLLGYVVVNRPNKGVIAPYIYENHLFASFLSPEDALLDYDDLIDQGYHGVNPAGSENDMLCTTQAEVEAAMADSERRMAAGETDTPYYFYERTQSGILEMGSDVAVTYVIIKGEYMGETYYYKVDIGHDVDGKFEFYDLLRNFCYEVNITEVGGAGSKTLLEAMNSAANNNISASTVTRDLFSIGYNNEIIEVSSTRVIFTEKTVDYELRFRYTVPADAGHTFDPEKLKIYDLENDSVEYSMSGVNYTAKPVELGGEVVESASVLKRADNWYVLRLTTKAVPTDASRLEQNLRIYYKGGAGLGRTVTLMLRRPWYLTGVTKDKNPTVDRNSEFSLSFTIPPGMSKTQFPLVLTFESDKQNIYASVSDVSSENNLTVDVGKSGFMGATTDNVIHYEWSMEWEDYIKSNEQGGGTYTVKFKTNTTSTDDQNYNTAGIDAVANGTRTDNNGGSGFCIRIANEGRKYIEPVYVDFSRGN